jgi:outer membrane protein OmpA-like peptidoglycan-associated protein
LFVQGSTQFADPLSYDIISSLADAIKELPSEERFVVEGHASAEGSYDDNMVLSQQRAERIVREIVRRGIQPNRLLPVGYGESEARHPENAEEALRSEDRRVVVFRLKEQTTAAR